MTSEMKLLTELNERMKKVEKAVMSQKEYLSLDELAIYLNVEMSTIYRLTQAKTWTLMNPNGKMKYVRRADIDEWIEMNQQQSTASVNAKANDYLIKNKRA